MDPDPGPHPGPEWRTIPNLLSFGRIVATPVVGWLIVSDKRVAAVVLLGILGVTDYLDGAIARATDTVTELGVTLDPVSDRVLIMAVLVTMMWSDELPIWLGAPILGREVAISVLFLVLARRGFGRPRVRRVGKTATFAVLLALPAILVGSFMRPMGIAVFAFGTVLAYVAAYRYLGDVREFLDRERSAFN